MSIQFIRTPDGTLKQIVCDEWAYPIARNEARRPQLQANDQLTRGTAKMLTRTFQKQVRQIARDEAQRVRADDEQDNDAKVRRIRKLLAGKLSPEEIEQLCNVIDDRADDNEPYDQDDDPRAAGFDSDMPDERTWDLSDRASRPTVSGDRRGRRGGAHDSAGRVRTAQRQDKMFAGLKLPGVGIFGR